MRTIVRSLAAALTVVLFASAAPAGAGPGDVVTNPFGNLTGTIVTEPSGTTPGLARLTIVTANGQAFGTGSRSRIFFGFRIMGTEDIELQTFHLTNPSAGCIVSDFAGRNTPGGWQGTPIFGAATPAGSANSHMRMIGGYLERACGNLVVDVSFRTRPFVAFYGAFYGYNAAPWHKNYGSQPWSVVPTGGTSSYEHWWNLWGSFDTLGYSNACTNVSGTTLTCG
ncbi:MAG TPA: hypothetical protein VM600_00325 [Actinomycetota bacterium]|nr:hypothetical protein [Actinomycetota bacterium]